MSFRGPKRVNWLISNDFDLYLGVPPLNEDPRNLFTLRGDLHLQQFNQANFVVVPKCGQLAIHFLHRVYETANLYHNLKFDHQDTLLHRLLYARFAWALCRIVNDFHLPEDMFNFDEHATSTAGSNKKGTIGAEKRKRGKKDKADSRPNDPSGSNLGHSSNPEGNSCMDWLYIYHADLLSAAEFYEMSDQASQQSVDNEDLRKARRTFPDF